MIDIFLNGSQVLTTRRCGLSSMALSNYFQCQNMTYNKFCVNKVSCFIEVYLCEQNELLYGGLFVWTKWVALWNLNLSPKSWVLALGILELTSHDSRWFCSSCTILEWRGVVSCLYNRVLLSVAPFMKLCLLINSLIWVISTSQAFPGHA